MLAFTKVLQLTDLPIEPLVFTPDEFKKKKRGLFVREILATGQKI